MRYYQPQIGDVISDSAVLVAAALTDPALPQIISLGTELMNFEQSPSGANPGGPGLGLSKVIPLLETYLFYRQHPFGTIAIGLGILALPVLLGVAIGRRVGS